MSRIALVLALAAAAWPVAARAGEAERCARAYEHGQELRVGRDLSGAREEFLVCARPTCPRVTRDDCTRWLGEVEAVLPGVVVRATSGGVPISEARVLVDGRVVAERLDARPITLEPGKHVVRVEPRGCAPREREVSLASGVPAEITLDVCGEPRPLAPPIAPARVTRRPPVASFVLGGAALVAVASFAAFGAVGVADADHLRATCGKSCDPGAVDSANAELAAADVSLGVAVACAAAAVIVWLVAPRLVRVHALATPFRWSF